MTATPLITLLGDAINRSLGLLTRALRTGNAPLRLSVYAVALALCAVSLFGGLVASGEGLSDPVFFLVLAAVAASVERWSIRLGPASEESISLLPTIFAAVLLGPLPALLVGAASMLGDLIPRDGVPLPYLRWGVYTSVRALTGGITGFVA